MAYPMMHKYHGWFRWSPRDCWKIVCGANSEDHCWELLRGVTKYRQGLHSSVVLLNDEAPFTLARGARRPK